MSDIFVETKILCFRTFNFVEEEIHFEVFLILFFATSLRRFDAIQTSADLLFMLLF